jgi:hypothetical protein
MYHSRFQELMTEGYALSNKLHFGEWNPDEFEAWIKDCQSLLSCCEPEPYFPSCPDRRHIEEIVFLLLKVSGEIVRGHIQYMGVL